MKSTVNKFKVYIKLYKKICNIFGNFFYSRKKNLNILAVLHLTSNNLILAHFDKKPKRYDFMEVLIKTQTLVVKLLSYQVLFCIACKVY